jgi:hypothetical protein
MIKSRSSGSASPRKLPLWSFFWLQALFYVTGQWKNIDGEWVVKIRKKNKYEKKSRCNRAWRFSPVEMSGNRMAALHEGAVRNRKIQG